MLIEDFLTVIQQIVSVKQSASVDDDEKHKNNNDEFVLKIEMQVDSANSERYRDCELAAIVNRMDKFCTALLMIYSTLSYYYTNVMFCFKLIVINAGKERNCGIDQQIQRLQRIFEEIVKRNEMVFSSCKTRVADSRIYISKNGELMLGLILKNTNTGKTNATCENCHMEPKYQYQCYHCEPKPWLSV